MAQEAWHTHFSHSGSARCDSALRGIKRKATNACRAKAKRGKLSEVGFLRSREQAIKTGMTAQTADDKKQIQKKLAKAKTFSAWKDSHSKEEKFIAEKVMKRKVEQMRAGVLTKKETTDDVRAQELDQRSRDKINKTIRDNKEHKFSEKSHRASWTSCWCA